MILEDVKHAHLANTHLPLVPLSVRNADVVKKQQTPRLVVCAILVPSLLETDNANHAQSTNSLPTSELANVACADQVAKLSPIELAANSVHLASSQMVTLHVNYVQLVHTQPPLVPSNVTNADAERNHSPIEPDVNSANQVLSLLLEETAKSVQEINSPQQLEHANATSVVLVSKPTEPELAVLFAQLVNSQPIPASAKPVHLERSLPLQELVNAIPVDAVVKPSRTEPTVVIVLSDFSHQSTVVVKNVRLMNSHQ